MNPALAQALSAPCSRDRLTHNDIVATTYLSMSKISASGGEIEGKCPFCAAFWLPVLAPAPCLLSYASSFESLQKREVCKVFVAHFPGRRALASERDGLVFRTGLTLEGGCTIRWSREGPFLQRTLVACGHTIHRVLRWLTVF